MLFSKGRSRTMVVFLHCSPCFSWACLLLLQRQHVSPAVSALSEELAGVTYVVKDGAYALHHGPLHALWRRVPTLILINKRHVLVVASPAWG